MLCLFLLAPVSQQGVVITSSGITLESRINLTQMAEWIKDYRMSYFLLEQYIQNTTTSDKDPEAGEK